MKKNYISILAVGLFTLTTAGKVSAQTPFTNCPQIVAVARTGTNLYNNDPVSFYNVNASTGVATLIPGGPLKNPASPGNNMDFNAAGLNTIDGRLYGVDPASPTPNFYRTGANYAAVQLGRINTPVPVSPANVGIVNGAAGEFDAAGNYFISALTGTLNIGNATFTPRDYYIGRIASVAGLAPGTGFINPTYTKINFSSSACNEYLSTLLNAITVSSAQNTGLRDLVFNPRDGKLYTYVSFEYPTGSGMFKGQLLSINTTTGDVFCYPATTLSFASPSVEVAGTAITAAGPILILFTNGAMYKTDMAGPNVYTGNISFSANSGISGQLRGDLAACLTAGVVAIGTEDFSARTRNCNIILDWKSQDGNGTRGFYIEVQNGAGAFTNSAYVAARSGSGLNTYSANIPAGKGIQNVRLREENADGSISYSNVISINSDCDKQNGFTIFSTGSTDQVNIRWNTMPAAVAYQFRIINSTGATVSSYRSPISGTGTTFSTRNLAHGVYLVTVQAPNGEIFSERFVK